MSHGALFGSPLSARLGAFTPQSEEVQAGDTLAAALGKLQGQAESSGVQLIEDEQWIGSSGPAGVAFATETGATGWASTIGVHREFDAIEFRVLATDPATVPSFVRVTVRAGTSTSPVLASVLVPITVSLYGSSTVQARFADVVRNTNGANLWLQVAGNGKLGIGVVLGGTNVNGGEPMHYVVNGNLDSTPGAGSLAEGIDARLLRVGCSRIEDTRPLAGTWIYGSGTFTGWSMPVGRRGPFNRITIPVLPWHTSSLPPSRLRVRVLQGAHAGGTSTASLEHGGTLLMDLLVGLPGLAQGKGSFVTVQLPGVVQSREDLWIEWFADGRIGFLSTDQVAYGDAFGRLRYSTVGSTDSVTSQASGSQYNAWIRFELVGDHARAGSDGLQRRWGRLSGPGKEFCHLPDRFLWTEGVELNLVTPNLTRAARSRTRASNDMGVQRGLVWQWNPTSPGTRTVGLAKMEESGRSRSLGSTQVVVGSASAGRDSKRLLAVGDSTIANGKPIAELMRLAATATPMADAATLMVASQTGGALSGVTASGGVGYQVGDVLAVHSVTGGGAVLTVASVGAGGSVAAVTVVSGGSGFADGQSLSILPVVPVGSVTASVADYVGTTRAVRHEGYSGKTMEWLATHEDSPFVFGGVLDFAQYLSTSGVGLRAGDWLWIGMGINDLMHLKTDGDARSRCRTASFQMQSLIGSARLAVPGLRVAIALPLMPTSDAEGFQVLYDTPANGYPWLLRYERNLELWNEWMLRFWSSGWSDLWIAPTHAIIDRDHDYPTTTLARGDYDPSPATISSNGVHPDPVGYWKLGAAMYATVRGGVAAG